MPANPAPPFAFRGRPGRPDLALRRPPKQARSRVTVEALLDAAIQVLRDVGFARCTTTRVAARAGVSVGSLYQYFPNREALLYAVKQRYLDTLFGAIGRSITEATPMVPAAGLRHIVRELLAAKRALATESTAIAGVMADVGDRAMVRDSNKRAREALGALLGSWGVPDPDGLGAFVAAAAVDGVLGVAADERRALLEDAAFEERLVLLITAVLLPARLRRGGSASATHRRASIR